MHDFRAFSVLCKVFSSGALLHNQTEGQKNMILPPFGRVGVGFHHPFGRAGVGSHSSFRKGYGFLLMQANKVRAGELGSGNRRSRFACRRMGLGVGPRLRRITYPPERVGACPLPPSLGEGLGVGVRLPPFERAGVGSLGMFLQ